MDRFRKLNRDFAEKTFVITMAVCFVIAFIFLLINIAPVSKSVGTAVGAVYKPIKPIIIAFIMTFFLARPTEWLEKKLSGKTGLKKGPVRVISALVTMIVAILAIALVFYIIVGSF